MIKKETGTEVHFIPDNEIFEETIFDYNILKTRFRETAFLTKGLKINLCDKREEKEKNNTFYYEGGIKEFVEYINKGKNPIYDKIFYCEGEKQNVYVEISFQHNDSYVESIYSFVNNINTPEGGTHLTGFRNSLTKVINDYARENKFLKDNEENLSGEDVREGLTAIISIKIEDPQFEGQTKQKLGTTIAQTVDQNPKIGKIICEKSILARRARDDARKARELTHRKTALDAGGLPWKLVDCSEKDPSKCEIFIVEGDSALGPAKDGRDSKYQAVIFGEKFKAIKETN